jgi:iron complex outermembrane recepter protein
MKKLLLMSTALSAALAGGVVATQPAFAQDGSEVETVVVTGFRGSLEASLNLKREAIGVRDSIVAEDIGKYPALNIAESLTRVPGVVIARDGYSGEGRQVTVRGLNSSFTIVTINGMAIHTETSGNVGTNTRAVDLDVFGADIFKRVDFYKTPQADLQEGGIAGVVDMRTAHPFDFNEAQLRGSVGESINSYRMRGLPRATLFASNTWGKFGALVSLSASKAAYGSEGSQITGPAQSRSEHISQTSQCGDSTPVGYCNDQNITFDFGPGKNATRGTVLYPGVDPRANIGSYTVDQIQQAFVSRFVRSYVGNDDRTRYSGVFSLQYKDDKLDITNDIVASELLDSRSENTFGMFFRSTGPTTAAGYAAAQLDPTLVGKGADSGIVPISVGINPNNNNLYGTFANTSRYNESRFYDAREKFIADWLMANYEATDSLSFSALAAMQVSNGFISDNRIVLQAYGLTTTFDNRNNLKLPVLTTPTDVTNVAIYSNPSANIGYLKEADRGLNFRLSSDYKTDLGLGVIDRIDVKLGVSYENQQKTNDRKAGDGAFNTTVFENGLKFSQMPINMYAVNHIVIRKDLLSDQNNAGMPTNWVTVPRSFMYSLHPNEISASTPSVLGGLFGVTEAVKSAFVQIGTDGELIGRTFRIGTGLRFSKTNLYGFNYTLGNRTGIHGSYNDLLPSLNLSFDPTDDIVLRASIGKTITRPALSQIAQGTVVPNRFNAIATSGNPSLRPMRATNIDFGVEWYFAKEAVLSVGVFYKQLKGLVSANTVQMPFSALQQPNTVLDGALYGQRDTGGNLILDSQGNAIIRPDLVMNVQTFSNLNPMAVRGVEVFYQQPFDFLPDPLDGFGVMGSLTYNTGNQSGTGSGFWGNDNVYYKWPVNGLAKWAYSATMYYEKGPISIRTTYNWNAKSTTNGAANNNHTNLGIWNQARGQLDSSIAYNLNDNVEFRVEGSNLLNEVAYQFYTDPTGNKQVGQRFAPAGWGSSGLENVGWGGRTIVFSVRGHL